MAGAAKRYVDADVLAALSKESTGAARALADVLRSVEGDVAQAASSGRWDHGAWTAIRQQIQSDIRGLEEQGRALAGRADLVRAIAQGGPLPSLPAIGVGTVGSGGFLGLLQQRLLARSQAPTTGLTGRSSAFLAGTSLSDLDTDPVSGQSARLAPRSASPAGKSPAGSGDGPTSTSRAGGTAMGSARVHAYFDPFQSGKRRIDGGQCVDLAKAWAHDTFGETPVGWETWSGEAPPGETGSGGPHGAWLAAAAARQANDGRKVAFPPDRWTQIAAGDAQPYAPGDLVFFAANNGNGQHGHVGVVVAVHASGVEIAEQNFDAKNEYPDDVTAPVMYRTVQRSTTLGVMRHR